MSKHFVQNAALRAALLGGYRAYARAQLWRSGPRIFVNSIPKAGTHLLTAELDKFRSLQNSRLHLENRRLRLPGTRTPEAHARLDFAEVERQIGTVRRGQYFTAHLFWSEELERLLAGQSVRTIFMARDPRDILVSRLHYALGLKRHWLNAHLTEKFTSDEARYHFLLDGHSGDPFVLPVEQQLAGHIPWTRSPTTLTVKFEELVGERGGGSTEAKLEALRRIADHCGLPADELDRFAASAAKATPTLRRGKTDAWRSELPKPIAERVNREWAPILAAFGYPAG
jgi:hypothetical protein